jgi:hypothetical protein
MKNLIWIFVSLLVFASNNLAQAQSADGAAHRTNTQIVRFILDLQERHVLGVAKVMPAEKYSFAPTAGAFKGVRTFAEELKHIAADNFMLGAGILGQKPPVDVGVTAKADRVKCAPSKKLSRTSKSHSPICTRQQIRLMPRTVPSTRRISLPGRWAPPRDSA